MEANENYYLVIPAKLLKQGNATKAVLFGVIVSLAQKEGYCWATNEYLASQIGKKEVIVRRYLTELENEGYIRMENRNSKKRVIYVNEEIIRDSGEGEGAVEKSVENFEVDSEISGYYNKPDNEISGYYTELDNEVSGVKEKVTTEYQETRYFNIGQPDTPVSPDIYTELSTELNNININNNKSLLNSDEFNSDSQENASFQNSQENSTPKKTKKLKKLEKEAKTHRFINIFAKYFRQNYGKKYVFTPADCRLLKKLSQLLSEEEFEEVLKNAYEHRFWQNKITVSIIYSHLNEFRLGGEDYGRDSEDYEFGKSRATGEDEEEIPDPFERTEEYIKMLRKHYSAFPPVVRSDGERGIKVLYPFERKPKIRYFKDYGEFNEFHFKYGKALQCGLA